MTAEVADAPWRRVTLEELRAHRGEIEEIGRRYGISNIRIFGSVACGDADDSSDLDLLIDVGAETGLSMFLGTNLASVIESSTRRYRCEIRCDADEVVHAARTRWLQNIGEAAIQLSLELRSQHHEVPWQSIIGMRHRVVHDYF